MHLSTSRLARLFADAPGTHLSAISESSHELLERFRILRNPARLNIFLATLGHESRGLSDLEEDLTHSAVRLTQMWPEHFPSVASARPAARDPAVLADRVFGGLMGNGRAGTGDGWRFRPRGYLRLAGRDAFGAVGEVAELDLIAEPDLVTAPGTALQVACGLWSWKGLNAVSDTGDLEKVVRRLCGGSPAMEARRQWLDRVRRTLAEPEPDSDGLRDAA